MNTSFEERIVWVTLCALGVVLAAYLSVAGTMLRADVTELVAYVPVFAISVVLLIVLMTAGSIAAAVLGRADSRDERDRLIAWRSEANASWVVGLGVLAGICAMVVAIPNVWVAHLLLLSLFLSEILKAGLQLFYYRRGF